MEKMRFLDVRTRGAGKGRPDYSSRKKWFNEPESSEDEVSVVEEVEIDGLEALQDDPPEEDVKPEATRAIVDLNPMMQTFDKHCRCPECDRKLITSMKMVYIASRFILTCSNPSCGYIYYSNPPAEATIGDQDAPMHERSTDYAVNVLWVLSFMSVGDGCTEAARLLGLLGLPNDTTMEGRSFTLIEDRLGPVIAKLTDGILNENLLNEVKGTVDANDFELLMEASTRGFGCLANRQVPTASCIL
jgi:hypothetical protein